MTTLTSNLNLDCKIYSFGSVEVGVKYIFKKMCDGFKLVPLKTILIEYRAIG